MDGVSALTIGDGPAAARGIEVPVIEVGTLESLHRADKSVAAGAALRVRLGELNVAMNGAIKDRRAA